MISSLVRALISTFKARRELALENVALRQQLAVLRRSVKRPRLSNVGLALLMFRISSRISGATLGRPGLRRRLFQVQYRLNPQRCQRMTVSGFTMTRTLSQSVQILRNSTQNLLPKSEILES